MSSEVKYTVEVMTASSAREALYSAWRTIGSQPNGWSRPFRVTVEDLPMPEPEQPQWWHWNGDGWEECGTALHHGVGFREWDSSCSVYGTTADRDAKRDALLAAAKEAGKPS